MNKIGFILIFISLYLFTFIRGDCYTGLTSGKSDDCQSRNITETDKSIAKYSYDLVADTCCLIKFTAKAYGQKESESYCYPAEKAKAKDLEKSLEKIYEEGFAGLDVDIDYKVDCLSSFIKYGLSFLVILLLN